MFGLSRTIPRVEQGSQPSGLVDITVYIFEFTRLSAGIHVLLRRDDGVVKIEQYSNPASHDIRREFGMEVYGFYKPCRSSLSETSS